MEEYSLIANSGIQFYVKEIEFDFSNTSKQLFHEWFDEDEVQTNNLLICCKRVKRL